MNALSLHSKRNRRARGVALVASLIMLAVVTLMAVVFLSITRRERVRTRLTDDQASAKFMADAALARVQAQLAAQMMASNNPLALLNLTVSTNYRGTNGVFNLALGSRPDNVGYEQPNGQLLSSRAQMLQTIANLQYDARPPVFVRTNENLPNNLDFRFYLDFNRNARFETNGIIPIVDRLNTVVDTNFMAGDPEWIGVLEYPDQMHGETNRFIGRYAFLVLPTGRALDINTMHNQANRRASDLVRPGAGNNGYVRGQGVGPWELNLAAFLRDLNTNTYAWPAASYNYVPGGLQPATAHAFEDARSILSYRYNETRAVPSLLAWNQMFPPTLPDYVDMYGDTPPSITFRGSIWYPQDDNRNLPWPGSMNTNVFTDVQELFTRVPTNRVPNFMSRLRNTMTPDKQSTYDRYTFYRMLSQVGVESSPSLTWYNPYLPTTEGGRPKVHLNYTNNGATIATNFATWHPTIITTNVLLTNAVTQNHLFLRLADNFIKASITHKVEQATNVGGNLSIITNYYIGDTLVRPDISVTNIQVFHNGDFAFQRSAHWGFDTNYLNLNREYSPAVHRLLQVAANIYDATIHRTNSVNPANNRVTQVGDPHFPSVFRPVFHKTPTNVVISGFVEESGAAFMAHPWVDVEIWGRDRRAEGLYLNANIHGVPAVIGAKKGYPTFNEYMVQSVVTVSRKLELQKNTRQGPIVSTNQNHLLAISNLFGIEAWNSYTNPYTRPFMIRATNITTMSLSNVVTTNGIPIRTNPVFVTNWMFTSTILTNQLQHFPTNVWEGTGTNLSEANPRSFVMALSTNVTFVPTSFYVQGVFPHLFRATNLNQFVRDPSFETPQLQLYINSRLTYMMLDLQSGRVLDFVNLDRLTNYVDVGQLMTGTRTEVDDQFGGTGIRESDFWSTNRLVGAPNVPVGLITQLNASVGNVEVPPHLWRDFNMTQVQDKEAAIELFQRFMDTTNIPPNMRPSSLRHQAPYTPTRKLLYTSKWQVNDPLVRFNKEDLFDSVLTMFNPENFAPVLPPNRPNVEQLYHNLGKINDRFRPWGGQPVKDSSGRADPFAFEEAVKDPLVYRSDDWNFPIDDPLVSTNNMFRFPTIGWLGRIHRGSPWQTIFLKAPVLDPAIFRTNVLTGQLWTNRWGSTLGTHPTNDWALLDTVMAAPHDNATRGLLGINQTNLAAWSAVLSGLTVWSNTTPDHLLDPSAAGQPQLQFTPVTIQPGTPQLWNIVNRQTQPSANEYSLDGINATRADWSVTIASNIISGTFFNVGSVLASPLLSTHSPYLNLSENQRAKGIPDEVYEAIPSQILSLLRQEEQRVTVYAFGQSLRPAPRSIITDANFYNLCTNYQVSGEFAVKAVLRFEGELNNPANPLRSVVESYEALPPE